MLSQEFHFVAKWIGAVPRHYFAFDSMTNEEKSFLLVAVGHEYLFFY